MAKISMDNFSDDELAKQYGELASRETWDEICKTCRMPSMLHKGPYMRKNEANAFECDKILDERDKFRERMKPIIKYIADQEEKKGYNNEQN